MKFIKLDNNRLKIVISVDELPDLEDLDELMEDPQNAKDVFMSILQEAYAQTGFNAIDHKIKIEAKQTICTIILIITKLTKLKREDEFATIVPGGNISTILPETSKKRKNENKQYTNKNKKQINSKSDKTNYKKSTNKKQETNNRLSENNLSKKANYKSIEKAEKFENNRNIKNAKNNETKKLKVTPKRIEKWKRVALYKFENINDFLAFGSQLKVNKINNFKELCTKSELLKCNDKYYLALQNLNNEAKNIGVLYTNLTEFSTYYSENLPTYYSIREKGEEIIKSNALSIGENL